MISSYHNWQAPRFRVLSPEQCQEIYLASLECLSRVGVFVNHEEARGLLASAGADVDGNLVHNPPHIIQDALVSTPRTFTVWGRDYQRQMQVAPDKVHFCPGPTCTYFSDPKTGQRRKAVRGDAGLTARVCDALEQIDYVMGLSLFDDVTPVLSPVYEFAESIANTTKPIIAWANTPETTSDIYRIAAVVSGGERELQRRPILGFFSIYESPLKLPGFGLGNMLWAAEHCLPVIYLGGPCVGLESPFSGASALVIHLATALTGLGIVQLKRRGAPVVIGGVLAAMDLRTARPAYGSPEMSLYNAAAVDVARYLGIPFMGTAGASESKQPDAQAGVEISLQLLVSVLSGAAMVHDVGFLDCADIGSLHMLLMANEVLGMVKRFVRGVEVNRDAIMMDLIEQVGPGGSFLGEPRSATLCRSETWLPDLIDRQPHLGWIQKGATSMETRLQIKLDKILSSHFVHPLSSDVTKIIETILIEAEAREQQVAAFAG